MLADAEQTTGNTADAVETARASAGQALASVSDLDADEADDAMARAERGVRTCGAVAEEKDGDTRSPYLINALASVAAAGKTLEQALEAEHASTWAYVRAKYEASRDATNLCSSLTLDAVSDDDAAIAEASQEIFDVWNNSFTDLTETPAPTWGDLAVKVEALVSKYGEAPKSKWAEHAVALQAAARSIGPGGTDADFVTVLTASGNAEALAFRIAYDRDGYGAWACWGGGEVAKLAGLVESILTDARTLAKACPAHEAGAQLALSAVWFGTIPGVVAERDPVEDAGDDLSYALRRLRDGEPLALKGEAAHSAWTALNEAEDRIMAGTPTTRAGVASQLLTAIGDLEVVLAGVTDELKEEAQDRARSAMVNAIRVLGLPFDYRTAEFYVGDRLADLDGRDRPGPRRHPRQRKAAA